MEPSDIDALKFEAWASINFSCYATFRKVDISFLPTFLQSELWKNIEEIFGGFRISKKNVCWVVDFVVGIFRFGVLIWFDAHNQKAEKDEDGDEIDLKDDLFLFCFLIFWNLVVEKIGDDFHFETELRLSLPQKKPLCILEEVK